MSDKGTLQGHHRPLSIKGSLDFRMDYQLSDLLIYLSPISQLLTTDYTFESVFLELVGPDVASPD
jgi:hypothetical protein